MILEVPRTDKTGETGSRIEATRAWRREKGELFNQHRVYVGGDERVLELHGGDGYTY